MNDFEYRMGERVMLTKFGRPLIITERRTDNGKNYYYRRCTVGRADGLMSATIVPIE